MARFSQQTSKPWSMQLVLPRARRICRGAARRRDELYQRLGIASKCYGFDPYYNAGFENQGITFEEGLSLVGKIARKGGLKGLKNAVRVAFGGKKILKDVRYSLHMTLMRSPKSWRRSIPISPPKSVSKRAVSKWPMRSRPFSATRITLQKKARGERPQYFADPAIDKTLAITLALAGEVAVLRDRIDSIERLAEAGQAPTRAAVDAFLPDAAVRAARDAWRDSYLDTVLRIIHQEREELEQRAADTQPYAAVIDEVEKTG